MKPISLLITALFTLCTFAATMAQSQKPFTLVIHGGAGTILKKNMTDEQEKAYRAKLDEALQTGYKILADGGTSIDAIVATIKVLEDSPLFNAGKGAVFANNGTNEMDASIMEGRTLNAGAVAGVTNIKNPVTAALAVMENSEHVLLSRKGAEEFAKLQGLEIVDPSYFYTESRKKSLERAIEAETKGGKGFHQPLPGQDPLSDYKFGTVGAAALDQYGNLAAATSTGGMTNKRFGRIGDSPIIGAGNYANNKTCAVSCTGHGEFFMRNLVAYDVSALMEYKGWSLEKAANEVVMKKLKKQGGSGGLIAVDSKGNVAMPFNTEGMYRGYIKSDGSKEVLIYGKE